MQLAGKARLTFAFSLTCSDGHGPCFLSNSGYPRQSCICDGFWINRILMKFHVVCNNGGEETVVISQTHATGIRLKLYLSMFIASTPSARGCQVELRCAGRKPANLVVMTDRDL